MRRAVSLVLGASTAEAQDSVGVEIAEAVTDVLQGGRI